MSLYLCAHVYFPVARNDWYPNSAAGEFGESCSYDMTFRIPKGMTMVATGTEVSDTTDGSHNVTVWKSELPMTVAGFNFGSFKREATHVEKPPMEVTSFANSDPPDWVNRVRSGSPGVGMYGTGPSAGTDLSSVLGSMNTTVLNKNALG